MLEIHSKVWKIIEHVRKGSNMLGNVGKEQHKVTSELQGSWPGPGSHLVSSLTVSENLIHLLLKLGRYRVRRSPELVCPCLCLYMSVSRLLLGHSRKASDTPW